LELEKTWDSQIEIRTDGSAGFEALEMTFTNSKFVSAFAFQELKAAGSAGLITEMPIESFPLSSSSISIGGPPGDRMGVNKEDLLLRELLDFNLLMWLTGLSQDQITQGGKIVHRIQVFQNTRLREYSLGELTAMVGDNRFLGIRSLSAMIRVTIPKSMDLRVDREQGLFPKFALESLPLKVEVSYSVFRWTRTRTSLQADLRIYFAATPRRLWNFHPGRLPRHRDIFSSDPYYRSAEQILENLQAYFPTSESHRV